ncbi:MAG: hypothetical protein EAZ60_01150 [Oscillatoriales cyanobacterium]|uniref:hypothetical protein n=1 Tax=Microcoleus sp. PH2017_27_LUM_O_A TaxID=2798837 RepID=UPI001D3C431F|nr:hypothetical protein [Microcoleus sp. PH2017_27_LUM_O_A]TAE83170.1 MAG: hypothetical protein EAZ83_10090 [Oscillatoriales cyanobacterium]TAE98902.1 MAG: hypothetical protein EAZ79_06440 [Oscillatoriales cyanobacterium]TAF19563.1 MAG: hypothetical protein EAZ73_14805 [Oscillatoriales cyanobacterium]TAF38415.1 MAG: hypothetical protein EAZ69_04565 [Oscillatoriales cyanobacterium]TAF58856.1 MAG: hypothetical protein EAZ60_01150 [Oscillatoriales cyanobacterium]
MDRDSYPRCQLKYGFQCSIRMKSTKKKEAILFANWAYRTIHDAIVPYGHIIAGSALSLPSQLPDFKYQLLK